MVIRALWIIDTTSTEFPVIFLRKYPTVENRAKKENTIYVPIPSPSEFKEKLFIALGLAKKPPEFVSFRDRVDLKAQLPVSTVKTDIGDLWPVVVIDHNQFLLCCLPLVDKKDTNLNLFDLPSVTAGYSLLESIAHILGKQGKSKINDVLNDVRMFLSMSTPFGNCNDTEPANAFSLLSLVGEKAQLSLQQKGPAWKPIPFRDKSNLIIAIQETVKSSQWDHAKMNSVEEIYGSIFVRAELEGTQTDVTLFLSHSQSGEALNLEGTTFHPCLHNVEFLCRENSKSNRKKLKFTPPLQMITLCQYISPVVEVPILGIYYLKGFPRAELSLQLTLSKNVKNNFSLCEVKFPFLNKGTIRNVDCKTSSGLANVSEDKKSLIWNIGTKFQAKNLKATITGIVIFNSDSQMELEPQNSSKDYAQLNFLLKDFTLSGCFIDHKSIQISPPFKTKINSERELKSGDYRIWNSHGDVPFSVDHLNPNK